MDETRRFLRYVLPGLAVSVEFALFFLLVDFYRAKSILVAFVPAAEGFGGVVAGVLGAGGLGFICGTIYHFFPGLGTGGISHRLLLCNAVAKQQARLVCWDGATVEPESLSLHATWRTVCCLWHSALDRVPELRSSMARVNSLADISHGLGSLAVGTLLALGSVMILTWSEPEFASGQIAEGHVHSYWLLWIGLLLFASQAWGWCWVRAHHGRVMDNVLWQALAIARNRSGSPVTVWVHAADCSNYSLNTEQSNIEDLASNCLAEAPTPAGREGDAESDA